MPERKHHEKNKSLTELRSSVTEILVANGRAFQPFIRTFRYTGENVTKQNLGTLLGVFEIDDQSEDSAYIVNFLASVAKKEYFNNPRRGAIESFEAALHKINLALAELVKHGNITWLGKFHGALGVLEKNNLHFSVSGHAPILLLRHGTIADISEGLASDESHIHPIKTFVEVSSGRLNKDDQVLLSSPELTALFSLEELSKHASRMGSERFVQFLKTALVNELDMAGLMVVDVTENTLLTPEQETVPQAETKPPVRVNNVFSQSAFTPKTSSEVPSVKEVLVAKQVEKEEEYIDSKTGHIYVQGDTPEISTQHPFFEAAGLKLQEIPRILALWTSTLGKRLRKTKKHLALLSGTVATESQAIGRKMTRAIRRQARKYQEAREAQQADAKVAREKKEAAQALQKAETQKMPAPVEPSFRPVSDIPRPKPSVPEVSSLSLQKEEAEPSFVPTAPTLETERVTTSPELPSFLKSKLAQFYQKGQTSTVADLSSPKTTTLTLDVQAKLQVYWQSFYARSKQFAHMCLTQGHSVFQKATRLSKKLPANAVLLEKFYGSISQGKTFFQARSPRQQYFFLGGLTLFVIGLLVWYFFPTASTPVSEAPAPAVITSTPLVSQTPSTATSPEVVTLLTFPDRSITSVILNDQVYSITEKSIITAENKSFPLPNGNKARFAAAMDDLRLIFIYTESGKLYAFSPISRTFVENTLPAENISKVAGIGTYLTYLYVLDSVSDQVYRFPRADGGFGGGVQWLREAVAVEEASQLAVNETLFIAPDATTLKGFFRGRNAGTFTLPEGLHLTDIYTYPGLQYVYALDSARKRIVIWDQEGHLIKEITHDKLSDGLTLSVNEKLGEFFIGTQSSLLSLKVK